MKKLSLLALGIVSLNFQRCSQVIEPSRPHADRKFKVEYSEDYDSSDYYKTSEIKLSPGVDSRTIIGMIPNHSSNHDEFKAKIRNGEIDQESNIKFLDFIALGYLLLETDSSVGNFNARMATWNLDHDQKTRLKTILVGLKRVAFYDNDNYQLLDERMLERFRERMKNITGFRNSDAMILGASASLKQFMIINLNSPNLIEFLGNGQAFALKTGLSGDLPAAPAQTNPTVQPSAQQTQTVDKNQFPYKIPEASLAFNDSGGFSENMTIFNSDIFPGGPTSYLMISFKNYISGELSSNGYHGYPLENGVIGKKFKRMVWSYLIILMMSVSENDNRSKENLIKLMEHLVAQDRASVVTMMRFIARVVNHSNQFYFVDLSNDNDSHTRYESMGKINIIRGDTPAFIGKSECNVTAQQKDNLLRRFKMLEQLVINKGFQHGSLVKDSNRALERSACILVSGNIVNFVCFEDKKTLSWLDKLIITASVTIPRCLSIMFKAIGYYVLIDVTWKGILAKMFAGLFVLTISWLFSELLFGFILLAALTIEYLLFYKLIKRNFRDFFART